MSRLTSTCKDYDTCIHEDQKRRIPKRETKLLLYLACPELVQEVTGREEIIPHPAVHNALRVT
ncbi:hypothetical protein ES319_A07G005000v1 [Gossypium barbadense]|uniref:Uncharacterized protein n=2 Tax=Gossypium TaxID=3633 RepID=A0A5J5UXM5_GOSBA|nr:hypothetical protein ES319_A07G005000v1 [Gossypium barbadense]TYH08299.1 hypothetical protein ES288_A07G004100v1 [Gossypium darwinii]